jgi:hypothetical protein
MAELAAASRTRVRVGEHAVDAAAAIVAQRLTTQGSGVRGWRASLSAAKAWTAPHPLQPIVRPLYRFRLPMLFQQPSPFIR